MKAPAILFFSLIACICILKKPLANQDSKITEIRFGTSFGMCAGYCIQEVSFTRDKVEKTLIPHRDKSMDVKKCSLNYEGFEMLAVSIDLEAIKKLEATIGCPDCADGGAEWIQIFTNDGLPKKVTYSYNDEPEAVKPFIENLREVFDKLGKCE
ncbi:MAG: hypothetical protein AAF620_06760 [Bacteroidota bacterium]